MYKVYRMVAGVKVYVQSGSEQEFPEKRAREVMRRMEARNTRNRKVYLLERVEG